MLENLTDDQIVVLTELTIHHGMLRYEKNSFKYQAYYNIAKELLEEVVKKKHRWYKNIIDEFVESQLKVHKEYEE